ncbi:MAG: DUF4097 family beta strand repeat-containing protein, partial [Armatimonadota bacterium]
IAIHGMELDAARLIADEIRVDVEAGADGPVVQVQAPPASRRVRIDLKVFVPTVGVRVSALSGSGDIIVRGVGAGVVAVASSGDVDCAESVGDVAVETASGDVRLQGIRGSVTARAVSGDIAVMRVEAASASFSTQSGDISAGSSSMENCVAVSASGDITLDSVVGTTIELRTVSGDATMTGAGPVDSVAIETVSGSASWSGVCLPATRLGMNTVSGDLSLLLPRHGAGVLEVRSRTGSVRGELPGGGRIDRSGESAALRETLGEGGDPSVQVHTLSGDVVLALAAEEFGSTDAAADTAP